MGKTADQVPQDKLELYRAVLDTLPDINLQGGMKLPHTSTNGYMYSSLTKHGRLGIRLSKEDRDVFIAKYDTVPFKNYGAFIKEHVEVPDNLLHKPKELGPYLARSHAYTQTLPPRAGKK